MNIYKLQGFIKDVLIRVDGRLNTKRIQQDCKWLKKHYRNEYDNIMNITKFLDIMDVTFSQRIWHIYYNKLSILKCKECGDIPVNFNGFSKGYFTFCSPLCASVIGSKKRSIIHYNKSKKDRTNIKIKQKTTHLSRSIVDIEKSNIKRKITNLKKFGVENPFQSQDIKNKSKQIKNERYGNENYNNREKYIKTCIKKYNVSNPMHSSEIFDSIKGGYKNSWHEFTLPSGKTIKIQGYEPQALKILLTLYDEDDILYKRSDMPEIWYKGNDNKQHKYYPDFYIPLDNIIVEVKSDWIYNLELSKNKIKEKATKEIGYNFKLMILDK